MAAAAAVSVAVPVALAGGPAGRTSIDADLRAAYAPKLSGTQRFDLTAPSHELFRNKRLKDRTVMQSFGFDIANRRLFAVQLSGGRTADRNGDLTVSRLDFAGNLRGHMRLKGFGHGVAIGVEPVGTDTYLWVETDPRGTSARGTRLARFRFVDGRTLTASSDALSGYRPVAGATSVTATIDPVHHRLAMRYYRNGWRIAVYRLSDVKARKYGRRLLDRALPAQSGETFQGYALYGRYLYTYYGNGYSRSNRPPGNIRLATIDLHTGRRVAGPLLTRAGRSLSHREPEGLAVYRTVEGQPRLFLGMASGKVGARRANLFYKNVLIS